MTAKSPDLLAPLDLAFWNIETPEHPMHLGALGVFEADAPGAAEHARELLAARAPAVPGLRMRIAGVLVPVGGAARVPVADFDPLDHVRITGPVTDFHAAAGALMERPLDRRRPPWEAHVLPAADGRSFAVLFKFHHALADGLRALTLAAAVLDPVDLPVARTPKPEPGPRRGLRLPFPGMRDITLGDLDPRRYPAHVRAVTGATAQAVSIGASVARATWGVRTSPALAAEPTGTRGIAGVVLDLDDIHRIRKTAGGTVNDVLIAVVAGAVRRWLDERGDGSEGVEPRALIPVSRRRPRTAHPQGNRLSGYLVRLPVAEHDPVERLRAVRAAMDRHKDRGPHRGAGAVALLADHVPPLGHRLGGALVGRNARLLFDLMVTSVPLPSLGLTLGGCPLTEVFPLAPLAQGQSLAVAVSTYRGSVHYGLVADAEAVPDLDRLARAITAEVAALTAACAPVPGAGLETPATAT
ncbi:wax ester/triacylglycerol synthase family O-acyltransferase [Streptomyces sp. NPDC001904]|uniref:wax ester/triacylglycerol synthase family O-acyltransferase n=1 Tax=Streptomyces sp. NPDC001904 TaxID=3154531 RepID=UPI003334180D